MTKSMTAREHAAHTYEEALKSLKRFYEAERDYDAVVNEVAEIHYGKSFDDLSTGEQRVVKHVASTRKELEDAAGRCVYARDRAHMLAAIYAMERDWSDRYERRQIPIGNLGRP